MELKLNIYRKGNKVEKTYKAETYDILYGTLEDALEIVDVDKIDDALSIGKMVVKLLPQIKPLLKDVFDGVTDEELRCVKVKELIPLMMNIFKFAFDELKGLGGDEKN